MPDFEPYTSALMSYIIRLKYSLHPTNDCFEFPKAPDKGDICKTAYFALKYAAKAALSQSLAYVPMLDELDKIVNDLWPGGDTTWYELVL